MESQQEEYKQIWKDEYLKWICGFANANGGRLFIGKDDSRNTCGLANYKKLLVDLPNKIVSTLGLLVDINVYPDGGDHYLEIVIHPSNVAISYHGSYYYRSGSTMQELKGSGLQAFLLQKMGRSWDDMPVKEATITDIDINSVDKFKKIALNQGRISSESATDDIETFLRNLHLITPDGQLKCAAILLFGKKPLVYFRQASFKIGRFGASDHDLKFQDVVEGNLFDVAEQVLSILRSKYLRAEISYEGITRMEVLEFPEEALREAILNAIVHKDYSGSYIQLSVYDDKLLLWNPGSLPEQLTIEKLKLKHASHPRNKNIADVFFKAGLIEAWGRGIPKILDAVKLANLPEPTFLETEGGFQLTLSKDKFSEAALLKLGLNQRQIRAVLYLKEFSIITNAKYVNLNKISKVTASRELKKMVDEGIIKSSGIKGAGSEFTLDKNG